MKLLSIDIGGTFIKYGFFDTETDSLNAINKVKTPLTNQSELFNVILEIKQQFKDVEGCAVSLPGTVDHKLGFVYQGGSLQYNNKTAFAELLAKRINVPVTLENDARCAAIAELWKGNLQNISNALVLVIGTGLGCGIIQNGNLYRGTHRYAGEFSLIFTNSLKKYGFEAALGNQVGIPHFVEKLSEIYGEKLDGPRAFELIENGEVQLENEFSKYLDNFSQQLFNFQLMFDPEKILIGGGISNNTFYIQRLSESLENIYAKIPLNITHAPLETCKYTNNANLIGAVKNFLEIMK